MARLIVIKGADEGKQFDLPATPVCIGRDRSNDISLHDSEVSRRHAEIVPLENGLFQVRDVGSANGTLVNKKRVSEVELRAGDHIQLGRTTLVFASGRNEALPPELSKKIRLTTQHEGERPSAIVKTIGENEGSRILAHPDRAATQWLKDRLANLSIMYETIQAVSHILDIDPLLERIMDLIFRSIEADHGCIMLIDPENGECEAKVIRYRDGVNRQETIAVSRTIMDYVLREKQGVLVSDAATDDRFKSGKSIEQFKIREAICVPMKGRHETHGVLFLDTLTNLKEVVAQKNIDTTGKFTEDHLALAIAIAHQAALAVEETRYHHALVNAERLAAIGQTIAGLSHHIKNIMQGVIFGSDMVRAGLNSQDQELLKKGWKLVEKNQGKIHEMVMDMLSFSKEREPSIELIDLNKVVDEVLDVVRGRVQDQNVQLDLRLGALPPVPADQDGLHKALLNIISNALDALVDRPDPYLGVQTMLESGGGWVRLIVLDHGVGIEPEVLADLFRPFVSTKGSRGTGLGLAVSRKIIREHGGDITVQSQPGKGSKFIFRLPMRNPGFPELGGTRDMTILTPSQEQI